MVSISRRVIDPGSGTIVTVYPLDAIVDVNFFGSDLDNQEGLEIFIKHPTIRLFWIVLGKVCIETLGLSL